MPLTNCQLFTMLGTALRADVKLLLHRLKFRLFAYLAAVFIIIRLAILCFCECFRELHLKVIKPYQLAGFNEFFLIKYDCKRTGIHYLKGYMAAVIKWYFISSIILLDNARVFQSICYICNYQITTLNH